jgi:hypothetical protein
MEDYQVVAAILMWRSARISRAQLHAGSLRISGEVYGATTTGF